MNRFYTLILLLLTMMGAAQAQFATMNFDAPNITASGYLGSYPNPNTVGHQVKSAYPMISYWTDDQDFTIEDPSTTYYNNVDFDHALRFRREDAFVNFGPLDQGFVSFNALYINGQHDAQFRVYVFSSNPGSGDPSYLYRSSKYDLTYTNGASGNYGINYYTINYEVPAGGYVRIESEDDDDFYIDGVTNSGGPMPVELTSFRSFVKDEQVDLQWTTATELNNYGFEVERSANGQDWNTLGFVEGHGTSFTPRQYSFHDMNTDRNSTQLYYRLKQVDRDGSSEYSDVIRVAVTTPASVTLTAYPQPFAANLNLNLSSHASEQVSITLYNSVMQKISSVYEGTVDGNMTMTIPTADLRDGSYFLIVNHADGRTQVQKLLHLQNR